MAKMKQPWMFAVFSGLILVISAPKAAADDSDLRQKALALNDITGDDTIEGEIKALVKDRAGTKQLLAVAVPMTKEKDQPFNYTGAFILARAAHLLKDVEASQVLYRVCADQAYKLRSAEKLAQAFGGLIDLLYENKKYDEGVKVCQEFLEKKEDEGRMRAFKFVVLRLMIQGKAKQGKTEEAMKLVDNLVKSQPNNWRSHELKGWVQHEARKYAEAAATWDEVLNLLQKDEDLDKELKTELVQELQFKVGNAYIDANQPDKAAEHFKPLLAEDSASPGIKNRLGYMLTLRQLIRAKAKQGETANIKKVIDNLVQLLPDNWPALSLKGMAEYEAGESAQAAKTWEDALDRLQKDPSLNKEKEVKSEFVKESHILLSNAYNDANQLEKATEHLQAVLANDPTDPGANNDLGYIWADHDLNLDEAEKMIRKALDEDRKRRQANPDLNPAEDKDNAAYLDSLGWVLFKKKKYQEAKAPLLKAVADEDGKHIEIYDHLGDIHMALGEKAEAIAIWKKALELKLEQKREKEIKTKVEKKLKEAMAEK
jgi:tetratricopeptide (TPR) repeat protein